MLDSIVTPEDQSIAEGVPAIGPITKFNNPNPLVDGFIDDAL